ncbi:Fanconi anemia group G protein [Microcaecilia unicolor]|uniref:Fanconi anemia group G protein n=1 Tax=Microcaecilia unicolor TaxID=1415580 RepID=A0A6P7X5V6_9AMPH|nr:Fanconi anemia group G protein [Microcaecilia unicolor]
MEAPGSASLHDSSCLNLWTEENNSIISRWRAVIASRNDSMLKPTLRQCHRALSQLLRKIQGLPAAVPSLSLELTVLYNTLVFQINVADGFTDEDSREIEHALFRVLDARGLVRGEMSIEELWQKILLNTNMQQLAPVVHRLAGLQGALWLAANQLEKLKFLFEALSGTERHTAPSSCEPDRDILMLLSTWNVPHDETNSLLLAQTSQDLKAILYTAAAFLQGLQLMEEGDSRAAAGILQEAVAGLCSRRVLAEIYTSIGCCCQRMGKPQMALQYWKQALQVDFQCLSALYQSLVLFRHLEKTDAELEALSLLHKALEGSSQGASSTSHLLVGVELLVQVPSLTSVLAVPNGSEVKYLLARRCLQTGRIEEAVEHYLDLMAVLQEEGWQPQEFLHGLPRVPEVFLEATSALLQREQHQDALTVSEKIVSRIIDLIPNRLTILLRSDDRGEEEQPEQSPGVKSSPPQLTSSPALSHEKKESLNWILWASTAYLHQGQALAHLSKHKDAVTQFSRCINLLFKVQFIRTGTASDEMAQEGLYRQEQVLQALKSLALLGRGCQFLQLGKDKDALRDLQLSLQANPGHSEAIQNLLEVLWRLGRKQEAAMYWQKFQSASVPAAAQQERRALPLYLLSQSKKSFPLDEALTGKIQDYISAITEDVPWP